MFYIPELARFASRDMKRRPGSSPYVADGSGPINQGSAQLQPSGILLPPDTRHSSGKGKARKDESLLELIEAANSTYVYANNNPTLYVDPMGEQGILPPFGPPPIDFGKEGLAAGGLVNKEGVTKFVDDQVDLLENDDPEKRVEARAAIIKLALLTAGLFRRAAKCQSQERKAGENPAPLEVPGMEGFYFKLKDLTMNGTTEQADAARAALKILNAGQE